MKSTVAAVLLVCTLANGLPFAPLASAWNPSWNRAWNSELTMAPFSSVLPATTGYIPYSYAPAFSASQYHSQDEIGQASFGYAHPGQAAVNYRDAFGNQVGSWAYINPEGKEVRVSYTADSRGFRVLSNDLPEAPVALPVPVQDTYEVAAAKAAHLAAVAAAKSGHVVVPASWNQGPMPVDDTIEVKAARAEFMRSFAEAKARANF